MFSESWHHVAGERIALRAGVRIRRQVFRGELWYVLADPMSNRFFRFRKEVYDFVCRLDKRLTVDEIWRGLWEADAESAPSQAEVVQLLSQLHGANLLNGIRSPDSRALFERARTTRRRETRAKFASILFIRVPLIDPEALLRATWPMVKVLFMRWMWLPWFAVVALGTKSAIDHWPELVSGSSGVLAPGNLPLLTLSFFGLKLLHEFGHAYAVKKYGGEVHSMGIMFLVFTPIPFVDATAAWAFRERHKRVFVGAAGMLVEFFVAGIAAIVWARTGEGLIHSLTFNVMLIASVSTLLFNINPLLRFDGYYILSDLIDYPNLQPRAQRQLLFSLQRLLFGIRGGTPPALHRREAFWLLAYGVSSWIYRLFILTAIMLFVADKFFGLGVIIVGVSLVALVVLPLLKFSRFLFTSPRLGGRRRRAMAVTSSIVVAIVVLLGVIPFPRHSRAPGILQAATHSDVIAGAPGLVATIDQPSKARVAAGARLLEIDNEELRLELQAARAELDRVDALAQLALASSAVSIEPVAKQREATLARLQLLEQEEAELQVCAAQKGVWVAPFIDQMAGVHVKRGQKLGEVIDTSVFEFVAVVDQDNAAPFFSGEVNGAQIRLPGEAGRRVDVQSVEIIPSQQNALPSTALGAGGGGGIAIDPGDTTGRVAIEPFFLVRAQLLADSPRLAILHRRSGVIRFDLPAEPLITQWSRTFRQLLQRRFRI